MFKINIKQNDIIAIKHYSHKNPFKTVVLDITKENMYVKLVNERWDDEQGLRRDFLCSRLVLNELHDVIFIDHRTRRGRQVRAQLECRFIGHADATLVEVFHQVL